MAKRTRDPSPPPAAPRPFVPPLVRLLTALTTASVYGGLLMPLVFSSSLTVYPFVFLKVLVFQAWMGLTIPAFLVLAFLEPRFRPRRSWVTVALLAHVAALGLSVALADDRMRAFWGNQERMSGFFTLLHFVAWYLVAGSVLRSWTQWRRLLLWQVALGFVMAVVALITLPFPDFLGLRSDIRISGLLGNAIFSATYHVFILFFLALLWTGRKPGAKSWPFALAAAASLGAIVGSGSRGPLLGLVAGALLTAVVWAAATRRFRALGAVAFALALAIGIYALIALVLVPLPALKSFWEKSSSLHHLFIVEYDPRRRRLWAIAWEGFLARPWTGWGLGNFESLFDVFYRPIGLCDGPLETIQDSSHSLFFDHLGQTGLPGFLSFLALWGAAGLALVRAQQRGRLPVAAAAVLLGLVAAYLVQGLFVFDSPALLSLTYLLLALAAATEQDDFAAAALPNAQPPAQKRPGGAGLRWALPALLGLQALAVLLVYRTSYQPGLASNVMRAAHEAYRRGSCANMLALSQQAFATPTPYLDDQLYTLARDSGSLALKGNLERCTHWRELLAQEKTVAAAILEDHPRHARQRSVHANFLVTLGRAARDSGARDRGRAPLRPAAAGEPQPADVPVRPRPLAAGPGPHPRGAGGVRAGALARGDHRRIALAARRLQVDHAQAGAARSGADGPRHDRRVRLQPALRQGGAAARAGLLGAG